MGRGFREGEKKEGRKEDMCSDFLRVKESSNLLFFLRSAGGANYTLTSPMESALSSSLATVSHLLKEHFLYSLGLRCSKSWWIALLGLNIIERFFCAAVKSQILWLLISSGPWFCFVYNVIWNEWCGRQTLDTGCLLLSTMPLRSHSNFLLLFLIG